MIPLFHDFEGARVVVVGGGPVALRKARRFAEEATVTVHAPAFVDGFDDVDCERVRERVTPSQAPDLVADAALVVAATDSERVNGALERAANDAGTLVNRADAVGDVVVPSTVETAELHLAISTGGASPTVAKHLRRELTPVVERADGMVRVQRELRAELKASVDDQARRKRLLKAVVDSESVRAHLPDDTEAALEAARDLVAARR